MKSVMSNMKHRFYLDCKCKKKKLHFTKIKNNKQRNQEPFGSLYGMDRAVKYSVLPTPLIPAGVKFRDVAKSDNSLGHCKEWGMDWKSPRVPRRSDIL